MNKLLKFFSVLKEHSLNLGYHEKTYIDAFNLIMMLNPCPTMQTLRVVSSSVCKSFSDGIVSQGMAVALGKHFEFIRRILEIFENINNKTFLTNNPTEYVQYYSITSNSTYNDLINIFNTNIKMQISKYFLYFLVILYLFF